jgi:release factor glutamine methyltransferase
MVVDLGTGSGAIALSIAKEVPNSIVFAVEKSFEALKWTKKNFMNNDFPNARIIFGDFGITELLKCHPEIKGKVSVIVSNPPYIPSSATPKEPEVFKFDPEIALYGGEDGLQFINQIASSAIILGCDGASLLIEHGEHQSKDVRKIFHELGLEGISTIPDLNGRERYTVAKVVKPHLK